MIVVFNQHKLVEDHSRMNSKINWSKMIEKNHSKIMVEKHSKMNWSEMVEKHFKMNWSKMRYVICRHQQYAKQSMMWVLNHNDGGPIRNVRHTTIVHIISKQEVQQLEGRGSRYLPLAIQSIKARAPAELFTGIKFLLENVFKFFWYIVLLSTQLLTSCAMTTFCSILWKLVVSQINCSFVLHNLVR